MSDSFTIEFKFTDIEKVYGGDKSTGKQYRKRFFQELLMKIWDINDDLTDGYFPLHKIIVNTNNNHDLPSSIEMSVPESIMKSYDEKD